MIICGKLMNTCVSNKHTEESVNFPITIFLVIFFIMISDNDMSLPKSHVVDSARETDLHENKGIAMWPTSKIH